MAYAFRNHNVQFVRELAYAIGLDPGDNHITGVTLEATVNEVAWVTVRMLIDVDQDNRIADVLKRYLIDGLREETANDDAR
jgi:hypothetical protein